MPVFRNRSAVELWRGIKFFWALEAGVTRGNVAAPAPDRPPETQNTEERERRPGGIRAEKMVWIFGSGRSGSTWLRSMMAEMEHHAVWEEPMVGLLFGSFHDRAQKGQLGSKNFIMADPTREQWIKSVRNFVLDGAGHAHPEVGPKHYLVIKEPNGSVGAPLLMEALPESRMIFLVRDPRDVVASALDATREGSWMFERKSAGDWKENTLTDTQPEVMTRRRARNYVYHMDKARQAYESHEGPKVLVKYEDLQADTLGTMKRIYSTLGLPADERKLAEVVKKHSWESIPEDQKGEGKFYRRGTSGGWREDLTPEQVEIVETITAPLLQKFYAE